MIPKTDTELTQRAAHGDRDAFGRLFDECLPVVWSFACRRTAERQAAETLTSRILRRAFAELESYDGQIPFAAWLHALALRVAATPLPRTARPEQPASPQSTRQA